MFGEPAMCIVTVLRLNTNMNNHVQIFESHYIRVKNEDGLQTQLKEKLLQPKEVVCDIKKLYYWPNTTQSKVSL